MVDFQDTPAKPEEYMPPLPGFEAALDAARRLPTTDTALVEVHGNDGASHLTAAKNLVATWDDVAEVIDAGYGAGRCPHGYLLVAVVYHKTAALEGPAPEFREGWPELVQVSFTVPVEVVVNLREGTVDRVVLIDEGVAVDYDENERPTVTVKGYTPLPDDLPGKAELIQRAVEIADGEDVEWPAWDRGW